MGYTIKQKIDICLKAESNPQMTQADLALWAKQEYGSSKAPSQTTISRILCAKNDLIASKEIDFQLVRRRKQSNPILRRILTEWVTQATWENIPITTPIIQLTANAIWNRLPTFEKDGNGIFNQKWCNHFIKKLNVDLTGNEEDIDKNPGNYELNKVWKLDEKIDLKNYLVDLIKQENYKPQDIFTIDEFQLFYSLPLDQIFDVSSIDKGLKQSSSSTENSLTIMIGTNIDGSEKLSPLIVGKYDMFNVTASSHAAFRNLSVYSTSRQNIMNKITEVFNVFYNSNINKWITSGMFQNYLLTLDHKLANTSPNRKILILLDDSSSHRIINLKFNNIKLCYMKNNANHKNPYNSSHNGSTFNFLPTSFGIIEEFKILYRLQQYLEMIKIQRAHSKSNNSQDDSNQNTDIHGNNNKQNDHSSPAMEVLSEADYHVPLIKVIEWIKRAWDSITQEKIHTSWKKSHLINFKHQWPASNAVIVKQAAFSLQSLELASNSCETSKSYNKLSEVMTTLNVVIPWEITDLLGLVNECGKITLSYVSIEEIIGSCLLEAYDSNESGKGVAGGSVNIVGDNENWFKESNINEHDAANILGKHFSTPVVSSLYNDNNGNIITSNTGMFGNLMQYPDYSNHGVGSITINTLLEDTDSTMQQDTINSMQTQQPESLNTQYSVRPESTDREKEATFIGTNSAIANFLSIENDSRNADIPIVRNSSLTLGKQINSCDHGHVEKRRQLFAPSSMHVGSPTYRNPSLNEQSSDTSLLLDGRLNSSSSNELIDNIAGSFEHISESDAGEIPRLLSRIIEMSESNQLKLTNNTIKELSSKLKELQSNNTRS